MSEGYFIGQGDKTSCGGTVLEGDSGINMFGILHAREGDRVSCGKDGQTYRIIGGISYMVSHGRLMAGTLDSHSGCPCKARLIPSVFTATYGSQSTAPKTSGRAAEPVPSTITRHSSAPQQSSYAPSTHSTPPVFSSMTGQEPGFYIVPQSMTREALEATLFPMRDPRMLNMFQALNPNRGHVKAGSMIVLSDPDNYQCSREEAWLMDAAAKIHDALEPLSAEEADFMARHHDEIASFLTHGSTAVGIGEVMFARHLQDVKNVLQEIEALHQRAFQADGHLRSPKFFAERKQLLAKLDMNLTGMTRKGIGFPDHPNLKSALGISSRSLVHQWTQAGGVGDIPGYATHIEGVAKAAKVIKYGGWIGTALGGGASYMKVQDVCAAGNTEACERVRFTETGSFVGEVAGGAAVGAGMTVAATGTICVGLGVPTGGTSLLICGLLVAGTASFGAGALGGTLGEKFGDMIYESGK